MAFYVTTVTFLATLPMNKFTNAIIPTYFQFLQTPIIEIKFDIICILTNLWLYIVMNDWNVDGKSPLKWQHCNFITPKFFLQAMTNIVG